MRPEVVFMIGGVIASVAFFLGMLFGVSITLPLEDEK